MTYSTTLALTRNEDELPVTVSGTYIYGRRGNATEPPEYPTFEDIVARDQEHNVIDLTPDEEELAIVALLRALEQNALP